VKRLLQWLLRTKPSRGAKCTFCGKYHSEVEKLIEGRDCYICNECVFVSSELLVKERRENFKRPRDKAAIADQLCRLRDRYERGQISEAIYLEGQRDLIRPWRKTELIGAPNGGPAAPSGCSDATGGPPSVT